MTSSIKSAAQETVWTGVVYICLMVLVVHTIHNRNYDSSVYLRSSTAVIHGNESSADVSSRLVILVLVA